MKKIGLLMVGLLLFAQAEFKRGDNDLTVLDTETQLEWQDSYEEGKFKTYMWIKSINYCEDLELDNKNNWRVPNINELKTIVLETQYAPTIDKIFKIKASNRYWSSTKRRADGRFYWIIDFSNARINSSFHADQVAYTSYIRCVRDTD